MSMEMLNTLQFVELLCGYLGCTVLLPALVFYRKVKAFPAAGRFLIYFTIGNFYIINLVQVLELAYLSCRGTLLLFTLVPAGVAAVRIYQIPVGAYGRKLVQELRHFVLREMGFRSFVHHRLREVKRFLCFIGRQLVRLLKEVWPDLVFLAVFLGVLWKVCWPGILNNWGFGASDLPVHNYWINGLIDNKLYIAGIYPMGMHCMLYYLSTVLCIPAYAVLRLFWLIQYSMIAAVLLAFLKGCCKSRFLPWLGVTGFVGLNCFNGITYSRFGATLPQEFGMIFILPSLYFVVAFFRAREAELRVGVNRIRCTSTWLLLGFAMSFSLTLSSHFYSTMAAGILCLGIVVGYGYWIWRKEYLGRILLAGILSVLMAILPMAIAFLTGKNLEGSMYWAMSLIGLREYTDLIFRILCLATVAGTVGGAVLVAVGIRQGKITLGDKPVPRPSLVQNGLLHLVEAALLVVLLLAGWHYRSTLLDSFQRLVLPALSKSGILYGMAAALLVGVLLRLFTRGQDGAACLSMLAAGIFWLFLLACGNLGWPVLMDPARACIYTAYMVPVVAVLTLDGVLQLLTPWRLGVLRTGAAWLLTAALLLCAARADLLRGAFGGGHLEMNEAILCTTNILWDNRGQNDKWTIVSANDELRMTEQYGRHEETITFLQNMEHWNPNQEVTIPTDRIYFYIEKKPLNYANGYGGTIPEVSREEAGKPLPANNGINAYNGTDRAVTMSRMYYWAQAFQRLYPYEMKVYFENDRFVCYYLEQNTYRLYNLAIDYGFNRD